MTAIAAPGATLAKASRGRPAWFALWPILPVLIYLAILFVVPVFQLLGLSLVNKGDDLSAIFTDPTLGYYKKLFATKTYFLVLGITFRVAAWTTVISVIAAYPVAYLLATATKRTRNNLILWVLMPFWTSFLVRTFAWMVLLGRNGTINDWLQQLGIIDAPVRIIYNFAGVMIGMVHALMPLCVITMLAVMRNIDSNLPRAANTLGARGGQAFWRVYFPLSLPGVVSGALLVFIVSLGFFITPALLGGGREIMVAQVIIQQIEELLNWNFAGAVAVLLLAVTFITFFVYDRLFGLSSLSGEAAVAAGGGRQGLISRAGGYAGFLLIAAMGRVCDLFSDAMEVVRPPRAGRARANISRKVLWVAALSIIVFLVAPSFFVIPISFSVNKFIQWPPKGFTWEWYDLWATSPLYVGAIIRSFVIGIISAFMAMAIGVPAAFVLTRQAMPLKGVAFGLILAPIIIPHIIISIALFYFYAQIGFLGASFYLPLQLVGYRSVSVPIDLILAHAVISVPFVVVTIMAVLKNYDERYDQAASSLGASKIAVLRYVTFPLILPGLIGAFLFAFVISLDELTIALFISGGPSPTLPKQMWVDAVFKLSPMVTAVSTFVLLFVTGLILIAEFVRRRSEKYAGV